MSSKSDLNGRLLSDENGIHATDSEPLSFDEIIDKALQSCSGLPASCNVHIANIEELRSRLTYGRLHLTVLGQFNRGKSTFVNALIGMNILPSSVLPLTSVPTLISWGQQVRCTIRFLNGKPDLIVQKSLEDISATLEAYVGEQKNPGNQLCVREAEVNCPSALLENGTVLIDTPGFGSTYLHNTRTALDTLVECDAALFLLSADPPLTQMEMEFLKQIQNHVPRIFFILNKIDLLSPGELRDIDRYIRETLNIRMGYAVDLKLYHICAIKGLKAKKQHENDSEWNASRMESVRRGILDFMVREKYFTLSQALTGKLKDALNEIDEILNREVEEYLKPIENIKLENSGFIDVLDTVRKEIEKEITIINIEKKAVLKFLDEQIELGRNELEATLVSALDSLLANKSGVIKSIDNLIAALDKILIQSLNVFRMTIIGHINRPLRKVIQVHLREFAAIYQVVTDSVGDSPGFNVVQLQEKLELLEIDDDSTNYFSSKIFEKSVISQWTDWFSNRQTRIARIRNQLEKLSKGKLDISLNECSADLKSCLSSTFEKIRVILQETYAGLIENIDRVVSKKKSALILRKSESEAPIQKLIEQIKAIQSVKYLLK